MIDPLAEVVTLLQPSARFSKLVVGAGAWRITRSDEGQPYYCVMLDGGCRIAVGEHDVIELQPGDFAMIPAAHDYVVSSREPPPEGTETPPVMLGEGRFRVGSESGPVDVCMLIGHCRFAAPDANLLVSLLPRLVHVRNGHRLAALMKLVNEESRARRPARDVVLSRLLEVLFIEALRATAETAASPGLVRGLADARVADALRAMHERPSHAWTVAELADVAALSRSAFFERFGKTVGVAPMAYLLAWRMGLAKQWLRQGQRRIAEIAERVGYRSASAFSVAFTRCVGQSPGQYARGDG
ncbi:MAG TPA: AraC family transcriptional regulator [Rhodanobacteraceae bacterium]